MSAIESGAGQLECIEALRDSLVNGTLQEAELKQALIAAADEGRNEVVAAIFASNQAVALLTPRCCLDALYAACASGHVGVVNQLLSLRNSLQFDPAADACSALHLACQYGHAPIVHVLLNVGLDPNSQNGSAVCTAAAGGHAAVMEALLGVTGERQVDASVRGEMALQFASSAGHAAVVAQLLALTGTRQVNASAGDCIALRLACMHGHTGVATQLLALTGARQVDLSAENHNAAVLACKGGHADTLKALLVAYADRGLSCREGGAGRLLPMAAVQGPNECLAALLEAPGIVPWDQMQLPLQPGQGGVRCLGRFLRRLWRGGLVDMVVQLLCHCTIVPVVQHARPLGDPEYELAGPQLELLSQSLAAKKEWGVQGGGAPAQREIDVIDGMLQAPPAEHDTWNSAAGDSPYGSLQGALLAWMLRCAAAPGAGEGALRTALLRGAVRGGGGAVGVMGGLLRELVWGGDVGCSGGLPLGGRVVGRRLPLLHRAAAAAP